MQFEQLRSYVLNKLKTELPSHLTYHNVDHTIQVLERAEQLAVDENVNGEELSMLRTAALLHDTGFIDAYVGHEEVSCTIARSLLPKYEYSNSQIDRVCQLIMYTRIPQKPHDSTGEILCDSDLYYLGTDDYSSCAETLYQEWLNVGLIKGRQDWTERQIKFLHSHHYFTVSAAKKLSITQHKNLLILQNQEGKIKSVTGHKDFYFSDLFLLTTGVITAGFSLKGFLVPNNFFDGGITGISLLLHEITGFNLSFIILLANLPFVIMGIYVVSWRFALKTLLSIVMLGICTLYIPYPLITSDKLLVSIFGGFFLGLGVGLTMRAGCALDGIEVLALYTWRRSSFTISEINLAINIVIFGMAAFMFGIQTSLYSMLTYFTASKTVDYVIEGVEAYTGVTIISGKSDIIKERLVNELGRGITVYKGERGFLPGKFEISSEVDIIFTVITRLELRRLKNLVNAIDSNAFVFANTIKDASGGIIKRRHIH